jgi:zinc transport system permease protein
MSEFIQAVLNPDFPFLRNALLVGLFSSFAFGFIGSFIVVRKISYIAGAISHSVLAGIGLALFCRYRFGWENFSPLTGAFIAGLAAALIMGSLRGRIKEREDTLISAVWSVGMALGLLFIAVTPGYVDPMSYLFGNILIVSSGDLIRVLILDGAMILIVGLLFSKLQASSFDEEFTAVRGLNPQGYYFLLLILTAVTVVLLSTVVGIILVIALLTLPQASAGLLTKRLFPMIVLSGLFTLAFSCTGISLSYMTDLPTGPLIIVIAGVFYMIVLALRRLGRLRKR